MNDDPTRGEIWAVIAAFCILVMCVVMLVAR